jgi:hypothetical protein
MNKYIAFYNGRQIEVAGPSSYAAQQKAVAFFKAGKRGYMVSVVLVELAGEAVEVSTCGLPGA